MITTEIKNGDQVEILTSKSGFPDPKWIEICITGKAKSAIKRLTDINSKVSCHYYIDLKGSIIQMVPDTYVAWHAGKSSWGRNKNLNKNSIGIEISNPGHDHGYKNFTKIQIKNLIKLSKTLIKKYSIKNKNILGHSDIAPLRKKDPGEKFPWHLLYKNKIGIWHNHKSKTKNQFNKAISNEGALSAYKT